ncbi:MAG: lysozyme inhibitor LprI family protein [Eubacteriales bacterium]|nr:lysozyme inhibitor LprI family protein [Eubacteriales bacterium]
MRKKSLISITLLVCATILFGCGNAANSGGSDTATTAVEQAATQASEDSEEADKEDAAKDVEGVEQQQSTTDGSEEQKENTVSLQEEIDAVEAKSVEYEKANWDIPQQEMNSKSNEWYMLWDDELNALWSRLGKTLSEDKMTALQEEQIAWVKRKEQNVCAAGLEAYGGSMQPLLENSTAMTMTRARVYELAKILAEAKQETFTISETVQNSIAGVDVSLDSVFEALKGDYYPTDELNIRICPLAESDFTADNFPEGTKWVFYYSHSDVLTEANIYAYNKDALIFKKADTYYAIQKGMEGDVMILSAGDDLNSLEYVGDLK